MSARRWSRALLAFLAVLWAATFGALLNIVAGAFDLSAWRWWLVGAAAAVTVVAGVVEVVKALRSRRPSGRGRVWQVERPDPRSIERPEITGKLVALLLADDVGVVGVTTGLFGAGGFGKTTLARQVCWSKAVRRRYRDAVWVTIGEDPTDAHLLTQVGEVYRALSGEALEVTDLRQASIVLGELLDEGKNTLLVVDDVWQHAHLAPFLQGGKRCTRLVTTRRKNVLPDGSLRRSVRVDQFSAEQARLVLTRDLPPLPRSGVDELIGLTGRWPLLVRLANRHLVDVIAAGAPPSAAISGLVERLAVDGPTTLDVADEASRSRAAAACIGASLALLTESERRRFRELAIFGEDVRVPRDVLQLLWARTGGLGGSAVDRLCERLDGLSLLADYRRDDDSIQLHDVIRAYLLAETKNELDEMHTALVEAGRPLVNEHSGSSAWWTLPADASYWWNHLCEHLAAAGRDEELASLVCDLRWAEARLKRSEPLAVDSDLAHSAAPAAAVLRRGMRQNAHLLQPTIPAHSLADILFSRLNGIAELGPIVAAYRSTLTKATRLFPRWPLPDQPHPALRHVLVGHSDWVSSCAVSPDGSYIVTTSNDGTARVWEAAGGRLRHELIGHTDGITSCAVSPDGAYIVTTSKDGTAKVWNAADGRVRHELAGHTDGTTSCAVSPDSGYIVTGGNGGTVRVWDAADGRLHHELTGHDGWVNSCVVSPNGGYIVTTGKDGTARVWDTAGGRLRHELIGHTDGITSCAVSPDSAYIVTTGYDSMVRVWDAAGGGLRHELTGHRGWADTCAVSPDSEYIVTAGVRGNVRVWDAADGRLRHELTGHTGGIGSCAVSPDGGYIVTTGHDGKVRVWDAADGRLRHELTGHSSAAISCVVSPDGEYIVTAGGDGTARVWDAAEGQLHHEPTHHSRAVDACAVSPDGEYIVTGGFDGVVRIWNAADGRLRHELTDHSGWVASCAVSPDGAHIVTGGSDGLARMWDAADGRLLHEFTGHGGWVGSCAVSPDGGYTVTTGYNGTVWVREAADGRLRHELTGHTEAVSTCAVSPDGAYIVTGGGDGVARVWDAADGRLRHELTGHTDGVGSCAVSPDGEYIVAAANDGTARVWEAADGRLRHELVGHSDRVISCAVSPDGGYVVTGSRDGTARVWEATDGRLRHELVGHTDEVGSCAVSPDGDYIVTTSNDDTVRLWDPESGASTAIARVNGDLHHCHVTEHGGTLVLAGLSGLYVYSIDRSGTEN